MIEPMLAKLTSPEVNLTGSWISEPKYDGERIIAARKDNEISLWTRRHLQVSKKFPEIIKALKESIKSDDWMLDGEMTVSGGFRTLLKRNVEDKLKISILSKKIPATYNIFDILTWKGEDLTQKPLVERKRILIKALHSDDRTRIVPFKIVDNQTVKDHFTEYRDQGYEGAVLKNTSSKYESGKRSGQWLKIKREDTVDVHVIGATKSTGSIAFGGLMMERNGKYFGKVGTGFSDQDRKDILKLLEENRGPLEIWVPPEVESEILITSQPLLAEIKVNEIIRGNSPRAPVWVRFRWGDDNRALNKICQSIKTKKRLLINYKNTGKRIIEPHIFGRDEKGEMKLRAYQREGYSESGEPEGWKLFIVDYINQMSELKENFLVRPDYNPEDPTITDVSCEAED